MQILNTCLVCWRNEANLVHVMAYTPPPTVATVVTDASTLGWGAHLEDLEIRGLWSSEEQVFHINLLEPRVIHLALEAILPSI